MVGLLSTMSLCAQVATGRITGRLTDSSGAVVPGGAVKTVNTQTNVETSTRSSSEGVFDLTNLIPGQYRLVVEVNGFKRYEQGPMDARGRYAEPTMRCRSARRARDGDDGGIVA
jgi:hypothetical protein